jgi:hypothetical protein
LWRPREDRVPVSLSIRVWGLDAAGKPFTQSAQTVNISRLGARLQGVRAELAAGDVIGLQHDAEKARFRVIWRQPSGEAGIHCVEAGRYIWGAALTAYVPTAQPAPAPAKPTAVPSRRNAERYPCTGGAELSDPQTHAREWGTVSDISLTGCYIETARPLPATAFVELLLKVEETDFRCTAQVRTSHPRVGMGVAFTHIHPEEKHHLEKILTQVGGPLALLPPSASGLQPRPGAQRLGPPSKADLALRFDKLSADLREVENLMRAYDVAVDPHLMMELRNALEHARQAAEAVQQSLQAK